MFVCIHDWAGPANQNKFFPTKGICYIQYINSLQFLQLSGWLVSEDPAGEEDRCGGPGLAWLHVVCGCEAGWTYCQILRQQLW